MFSETEKKDIELELSKAHDARMACPEVLKVLQRHRGWISDETLADASQILAMSTAEVDAVATAYNMIFRRPVGRHVILICDSVTCYIMGYDNIRSHLKNRLGIDLGQTTEDNRFTLLPVACLGACDVAPAMMIDNDLHGNLDAAKIDRILETYT
jgi:NADH-quinone oxidoreductase subunit E